MWVMYVTKPRITSRLEVDVFPPKTEDFFRSHSRIKRNGCKLPEPQRCAGEIQVLFRVTQDALGLFLPWQKMNYRYSWQFAPLSRNTQHTTQHSKFSVDCRDAHVVVCLFKP